VSLFPLVFAFYWLSVLLWCGLAERLCTGLSGRHPLLYKALGRPAALAGADLRGSLALLGFLLRRRDRFTGDRELSRLCGAMRTFLIFYALVFLSVPAFL
jgi:hypothetical protein